MIKAKETLGAALVGIIFTLLAIAALQFAINRAYGQNVQTTDRTPQQTEYVQSTNNTQDAQPSVGQAEDYCVLQCSQKVQ